MRTPSQTLVHALLASQLHLSVASLEDANKLDDLGADWLALFLIASKLEELAPEKGDFPMVTLAFAKTVGDLVKLVESWVQCDGTRAEADCTGPQTAIGAEEPVRRTPGAS